MDIKINIPKLTTTLQRPYYTEEDTSQKRRDLLSTRKIPEQHERYLIQSTVPNH